MPRPMTSNEALRELHDMDEAAVEFSNWETDFAASVFDQEVKGYNLTKKQISVIEKMVKKYEIPQ